ncbi:MAG: hypothetical protein IAE97_10545 [Chthoniobacterales bacterium]|nr:hypothetical protein [Chthoniobacterales bacterium]
MKILCDTREPWPHPWQEFLPEGWHMERGTLETGDLAIARLPAGVVIERKTASDFCGCIGKERERFERELKRSRYVGRFIVVIEADLETVCRTSPGLRLSAIFGSVAAWSVRYCPFIFAGGVGAAAQIAFRAMAAQVRDIERQHEALKP